MQKVKSEVENLRKSWNRKIGRDEPLDRPDKRDSAYAGLSELTEHQAQELERFLNKRLSSASKYPRAILLAKHHIDVRGHPPIKQRYRNYSTKTTAYMNKELDKFLEAGMVKPSANEWSHSIVMVTKSDGTYRMCLDFRKVNEVAKKDVYPLSHMDTFLSKLRSAKYIMTIDLSKAFHDIPLARNSCDYTAFTIPGRGLFHYKRMPFGFSTGPATFQWLIDRLICPELEPHVFTYQDDIIIVIKTFEEHMK